jgi:hypothetical protein
VRSLFRIERSESVQCCPCEDVDREVSHVCRGTDVLTSEMTGAVIIAFTEPLNADQDDECSSVGCARDKVSSPPTPKDNMHQVPAR